MEQPYRSDKIKQEHDVSQTRASNTSVLPASLERQTADADDVRFRRNTVVLPSLPVKVEEQTERR